MSEIYDGYIKVSKDLVNSILKERRIVVLGVFGISLLIVAGTFSLFLLPWLEDVKALALLIIFAKIIEKVTEYIGFAIIVAIAIDLVLESTKLQEIEAVITDSTKKFKKNSFKAVYGWTIPKKIVETIHAQVFRKKIIREYSLTTFTLRDFKDEEKGIVSNQLPGFNFDGRIVVDFVCESTVKNLSSYDYDYFPELHIEKEDAEEFNRCICYKIIERETGTVVCYYDEQKAKEKKLKKDDVQQKNLQDVSIINNVYKFDGVILQPEKEYSIYVHCRFIRSCFHAREVWTMFLPTEELTVRIVDTTGLLDIHAELLTPYDFSYLSHDGIECNTTYPLLPYQGYTIVWHKQSQLPPAKPGA